jgi:hypothetical protein
VSGEVGVVMKSLLWVNGDSVTAGCVNKGRKTFN